MSHRRVCSYLKVTHSGYLAVRFPDHPRADPHGWLLYHILIAEWLFGGPLPPGTVVHHLDGVKTNNSSWNLYLMRDQAEHVRIHAIERRYDPWQVEIWPGIEYEWWAARNPLLPRID